MSSTIPQPPAWPIVGNLFDVDLVDSIKSLDDLADKYGEIYKLSIFGRDSYIVSSVDLVEEVCDESRFGKIIDEVLEEVRNATHDGLFTAHNDEPNWGIAHRTLMPSFGPLSIKNMFDEMHDIASQLVSKWARMGPDEPIDLTADTTRLTFDTIALCACGIRFNSFYREDMHPFINTMGDWLLASGVRSGRTTINKVLNPGFEKKYWKDVDFIRRTAQDCIDRRRSNPSDKKDLLNAMLYAEDAKSGQRLTESSVVDNMITFLVAGHETTSGLLSFTIFHLLNNPEALQKAQDEVDTVIGGGLIQYQHMSKLPYIEAALRETLRLNPSAPSLGLSPLPGTQGPVTLKGKYIIPPNAQIIAQLTKSQRDPTVFGEDAAEYKPERMLENRFRNLRSGAWKPFGNGKRGCIGRSFAWQEAVLAMAMILQNFHLRMADPGYQLKVSQTLTQKPGGFQIKASLRPGIDSLRLPQKLHSATAPLMENGATMATRSARKTSSGEAKPITILFGSSSGTCEGLAHSLASSAQAHGFNPSIRNLNGAVDNIPTDQPIIVITCTYEGQPSENAKIFMEWLQTTKNPDLSKASFAVFGCGHRDWVSTYQRVPKAIEQSLLEKGATQIIPRGETDVSKGTIFDDFDEWTDKLEETLSGRSKDASAGDLSLQISTNARAGHLRYHHMADAKVISNEKITASDALEKRHMVFKLPPDMRYEAGDYLAVLPVNNTHTISRVLRRFSLPWDAVMTITEGTHATVPIGKELSVAAVLGSYVELSTPATRKNKEILSKHADHDLSDESGSAIDILERHPGIKVPFSMFLAMLPPLRLRQYSISSSPMKDPTIASITFSVLGDGKYLGTATNYLKDLEPDSTIQIAVKKCSNSFRLPRDDSTPIIMVCAGAGIAPFHGFIEERAIKKAAGKTMSEALLFIGCRGPEDKLLADDFCRWEKEGAVKVFYAHSRHPELTEDCKYVQDRLWRERDLVSELFDHGARAYVCGSSRVGQGVSQVAAKIASESSQCDEEPMSYEEALKWWEDLRGDRYAVDVFD